MAPRAKKTTTKKKAPAIRGLAVGTVIPGLKVFRNLEATEELTPERAKLVERYRGLEVDVRRLSRAQVSRFRQEVSLAASLWDDVDQEAKDPEARKAAVEKRVEAQEALLAAYRGLLLAPAEKGGHVYGSCLVAVRPIVLVEPDGAESLLETLSPKDQVEWLEELGLLDSVGQSALQGQSTEAQNLHL